MATCKEEPMEWEIYSFPNGWYRAELFRGTDPTIRATIRTRWWPMLYARMVAAQVVQVVRSW